ncbi:MAG: hypothetical protein KOO62_00865 [candidate division Zixibacteria bacterium]|nr:hypothetical protein [candidate division Zixibacteria bacterium]
MTRLLIVSFILALSLIGSAGATDGVKFAIAVYQSDSLGEQHLLLTDTINLARDITASGFLLTSSTDIQLSAIDSSRCTFAVHLVTLGSSARTYSRNFTVEYGLPAKINDIIGKNDGRYSLVLTPLERVDIDPNRCEFDHGIKGTFKFNPTAHLDIYFIPNSLGDFYWETVKGMMEFEYRQFKNIFGLNLPGKHKLFLCPCPLNSVIWDMRFGQVIDPTRNTSFALYAPGVNSADPFLILQTAILRQFGYAPPFLSEGVAGYLSLAAFDMKQLIADGRAIPLDELLDTYTFLQAPPAVADRSCATFVKFLIDTYGLDRFRQLFINADDLNLATELTKAYGQSVDSLEQQWLTYVDTTTFSLVQLGAFVDRAEAMFDYSLMNDYAQGMVTMAATPGDSLMALTVLKKACFLVGDYYGATEAQQALLVLRPNESLSTLSLAGYKMMNGLYEEARRDLEHGLEFDSTNNFLRCNLGLNHLLTGDTLEARMNLMAVIANHAQPQAQSEARIMLADLLAISGQESDRTKAEEYYQYGLNAFGQQLQLSAANPTAHLWMGISTLGLQDAGNALNYLEAALFTETRPFYIGMINLWLGKANDILGQRQAARDFYGAVLAGAAAHYHQEEARRFLDQPYTQ